MALDRDPLRTLGLPQGASQAEIKAAYRRLAKAFHPDTAGEAAVPRFLAIQAAYEKLTGTGARGPAGAERGDQPAEWRADGWRADPDRARATRDAWRARSNRPPGGGGRPAGAGGGTRPGSDQRPASDRRRDTEDDAAAGPTGRRAGPERDGRRPGRATGSSGPRDPNRPGGVGGEGSARSRGTGRSRGADPGTRSANGAPKSRPRSRSRPDRPPDRATPGSTTYDFADQEPFDPEWSGASWYGTSSGTYWTINPKEYADPRKHGPEYLARARRRAGGEPIDDDAAPPNGTAEAAMPRGPGAGARPRPAPTPRPRPAPDIDAAAADEEVEAPASDRPAEPAPGSTRAAAAPTPAAAAPETSRDPRLAAARARAGAARAAAARRHASAAPMTTLAGRAVGDPPRTLRARRVRDSFPPRSTAGLRLALALLGWPPLGFALAGILGEVTGCSRFAAACAGDAFGPATWLIQLAVIGLLVAFPRMAAISAVGTVAAVVASVPATMLLSSTGGPDLRPASVAALLVVLAIAYVAGVAFAVVRRSRTIGP